MRDQLASGGGRRAGEVLGIGSVMNAHNAAAAARPQCTGVAEASTLPVFQAAPGR
ncbi:hypothetical protein [Mycobacterium simiae]|uniref:hypothetical protein n=1 Tax=Mycobacterium simiae TaxID=1784 RepID=UPI00165F993A|nr:hypothetical protein [Mycobacterium simiae]